MKILPNNTIIFRGIIFEPDFRNIKANVRTKTMNENDLDCVTKNS
jgi:hypothetical protein